METFKFYDSRITKNADAGCYLPLCRDILKSLGIEQEFTGGWHMTQDYFSATSYKRTCDEVDVNISLDFKLGQVFIRLL